MSETNNNLDLTQVPSENLDEIAQKVEAFYKNDASVKTQLAWNWERVHNFIDGRQWLTYMGSRESASGGMWQQLKVSKANEYIPRPVTNYIFDSYQTLKSYLLKSKPRSSVTPNTQTHRDKSAAKISTLILEANWERLKEQYNYEYAAACLITYGTVFKKDYWDTSTLQMVKLPKTQPQPIFDPNTAMQIGVEEKPVLDEQGQPVHEFLPLGDINTDVVEPYRIAIDPLATDLHKARWIMEFSIQPMDLVKELFSKSAPGYTGRVNELQEEKKLSGAMQRFYNLKQSSGVRPQGAMQEGSGGSSEMVENSVVLKEYYERPCAKYPKGRYIVVANGIPLYAGDSPCEGPEQGDWHPYSECRWEVLPGRFWGKGPLDDACESQKQINSIDSIIILTRKTQAIPQKLIPMGSGVALGQWTGRPGQEIPYRADPSGSKPEIIPAAGVHESVFVERGQKVEDIKTTTGAIDILKGDRPPGVTAASALNMLYEVGTGKLFPILDRWKAFVENSQKKQLKLIAKFYQEPRPDFIKLLHMKNTELAPEDINKFIGSDLYDNFNVVVEAGSNIPKLQAAHQAQIQEAAQMGALELQIPANRVEYQRQMGITGFDNDVGPDMKRAEWENAILDDTDLSPSNKAVVLVYDDHDIHVKKHTDRMKEPSFMALSQTTQQAYMQHVQEHEMFKQQAMQAAMMQAAAMGAEGPMPVPGQSSANHASMPTPNHGLTSPEKPSATQRGPSKEVKNSLKQDMLPPGQVGNA